MSEIKSYSFEIIDTRSKQRLTYSGIYEVVVHDNADIIDLFDVLEKDATKHITALIENGNYEFLLHDVHNRLKIKVHLSGYGGSHSFYYENKVLKEKMREQQKVEEEERYKQAKNRITKILKDHDIEMSISGCGCCGSPTVSFKHKGEVILTNESHFNFNTED